MVDLAARHRRLAPEVEAAVLGVLRGGRYIGGPVVESTCAAIAGTFGWAHGVGVNSGTDALIYAMQAVGVRPGDRVALPAVTFFATAGAVCRIGAIPVLVDIRADLPLIDADRIPRDVQAVIAVHLFGESCPLPALPVPVIDDSAQAIGAAPPPRTGVIAAASFYPTKTLGAYGDGGIVMTDEPALADAVRRLTHHGIQGVTYYAEEVSGHVGANSRLDAVQAAILGVHLADLPRRIARRRAIAARYDVELPDWVERLPRCEGHPVHQYVVLCDERDDVKARLAARGVDVAIYYPHPLTAVPALAGRAELAGPAPNAERFCRRCLALPVHEELTDEQVDRVVAALRSLRDG